MNLIFSKLFKKKQKVTPMIIKPPTYEDVLVERILEKCHAVACAQPLIQEIKNDTRPSSLNRWILEH